MDEISLLQTFLPPMPTEADIDRVLREVVAEENIPVQDGKKVSFLFWKPPRVFTISQALGLLFKAFYSRIPKDSVDPELVKRKANAILSA
jgi:hypothetical protein